MTYVGLSPKEAYEIARGTAWDTYLKQCQSFSPRQSDTDEPAAWKRLQDRLAEIESRWPQAVNKPRRRNL